MRELKKIWIFEPNKVQQDSYRFDLEDNFDVTFFDHPRLGLIEYLKTPKPDLILSDTHFDGQQGELSQWIHDFSPVDIWLIPSDTDLNNLRKYQSAGINTFISKNLETNLLLISLENYFSKREQQSSMTELKIGNHTIKDLTRTQYKIIGLFLERRDREVSREEFQKKIWGNQTVHHKNLNVQLHLLRKKLNQFQIDIKSLKPGHWTLCSHNEVPRVQI
ncbi:MAG: hypothetical protein COW00_13010 [Bdellovibrio sp. CG12_big_fil_rev_8_21_14_0_65_39_13]|nr:MAG: hypothetical protein COW78_05330 [Bdellovibrio sp. CG22_combo_CG10-13_8_21_14_all_39_27]PIQ59000.1 MAG: hypothetical protein COW00_13010 [Bdellovibrio sp. CG12_big_fil_rev_8_21_14_0_65_39_13]PIR33967.1 MAG: hypothetical protein COV37_14725 [Bdellovibrio sp. CG11_big_fil_rev_8_21_14_0_20_39_38]